MNGVKNFCNFDETVGKTVERVDYVHSHLVIFWTDKTFSIDLDEDDYMDLLEHSVVKAGICTQEEYDEYWNKRKEEWEHLQYLADIQKYEHLKKKLNK